MKKILISFLSFIMFFAIGVSITQLVKTNENYVMAETASVEHEEFVMETGAAFRPYWTTPSCGITYNAKISNSLIGKGYQPKLFVVPYDYITNMLNSSDNAVKTLATSGDYKGAAEAQGYSFIDLVPYVVSGIDGYSWLVGGVKNINNNQMNRKFFGVFYYEKGTSRVYADILYDNPINNARSMAYVTSSAYYEMEDTINAGTAASYAEDMLVHFMDMAIARAVYKAGVTDATPASITYKNKNTIADNDIKSESVSAETKESGRRVRIITFDTTIGLTASYYDDLFTYQMRIGYIKKTANGDGTYSYSPVSVDVTKYLDFKLDIISVNNAVKEYVSIDLSTNYITPLQVGTVTSKEIAVRAGMEPTSNKLGMPVTITSFDLTENSS